MPVFIIPMELKLRLIRIIREWHDLINFFQPNLKSLTETSFVFILHYSESL